MKKFHSFDTVEDIRTEIVEQAVRIAETLVYHPDDHALRRAIRIAIDIAGGAQTATDMVALKLATKELNRILRRAQSRNMLLANVSTWNSPLVGGEVRFAEADIERSDEVDPEGFERSYLHA